MRSELASMVHLPVEVFCTTAQPRLVVDPAELAPFVVDTNPDLLLDRIKRFADTRATDDAVRRQFFGHRRSGKYPAGDTRGWRLGKARRTIQDQPHVEKIRPINYRPFDTRYIYFDSAMVDWPRIPVMRHFIADNIGLIFKRGDVDERSAPIFSTRHN